MRSHDVVSRVTDIPDHEVVRLLMAASHTTRSQVLLGFDVSDTALSEFERLVRRRRAAEPLQYIEGSVPFGPVEIHVDPRVLIPRPETEYMFELVVEMLEDPKVIVDLCTGSGSLALALVSTFPDATVYATDLSQDAVSVARENAATNNVDVEILVGDLFDPLPGDIRGRVDLVISNPPYIAQGDMSGLPVDVRAEPAMALLGGPNGDEILERIARSMGEWLSPDGIFMCEISEYQGDRVVELFHAFAPTVLSDLTGRDRYVVGQRRVR